MRIKQKNKAFTLAEILGVIVVISLLLVLIVPAILNQITNSEEDATKAENEFIYNAADLHIRENPDKYPTDKSGKYCIPIKDLIDEGKLVEPVKDVVTEEDLSDKSVLVTIYSTGTKEYEIKGAECSDLAALPMIDFIIEPSGSSWVKERTVTIIYPKVEGTYTARYRREDKNSYNWNYDSRYNNGGELKLTFDTSSKSTLLEAQLKGKNIISSKINIVNIDNIKPTVKASVSTWTDNGAKVKVTSDDNLSGVNGICILTSNIQPDVNNSCWETTSSIIRNLDRDIYYFWSKDRAGNISNSYKLDIEDNIKPTCTITASGTAGSNDWYRSNVTLKMSVADNTNGSGVASYGMGTTSNPSYNGITTMTMTTDNDGTTYYGKVIDNAGNVGTCSKTVKKDSKAPSCSLTASGTIGNNGWYRSNVTVKMSKADNTNGSGILSYGITISSSASYNGSSSVTQTQDTKEITYYGYVKDAAGNTAKCSKTIKKDSTKPTLTYTLKLPNGSNYTQNTWSRSAITRNFYPTDNMSGYDYMEYNAGNGWIKEGNVSSWVSGEGINDARFRVIDKAGNISGETHIILKVDWTPPDIPYCYNFGRSSSAWGDQVYSSNCNGSLQSCWMDIKFISGHQNYDYSLHNYDNLSGVKETQYYWWPDRQGSGASFCNWTTSCGFYFPTVPVYITQQHRKIDNAGNVSGISYCDVNIHY